MNMTPAEIAELDDVVKVMKATLPESILPKFEEMIGQICRPLEFRCNSSDDRTAGMGIIMLTAVAVRLVKFIDTLND